MEIQSSRRIEAIRQRVAAEFQRVSELEPLVQKSEYFQSQLRLLRWGLEDVERVFLADLLATPRPPEKQAVWLSYAENHLQASVRNRESIQKAIKGADAFRASA